MGTKGLPCQHRIEDDAWVRTRSWLHLSGTHRSSIGLAGFANMREKNVVVGTICRPVCIFKTETRLGRMLEIVPELG